MALATELVTLADVLAARELLGDVVRVTPMERSRALAAQVGGPVLLKCENLQRTGSFKLRGAYTRIARLTAEERSRGVVAASAGNHAQGVALAARLLGTTSTVFMPGGAPLPKVAATRAYGATVRLQGDTVDRCLESAQRFARETGAVFIHPFDHPDVVAGQGTLGLEILEQCPDVRTVVVCTGGGGLVAGVAVAIKALRPDVRVVGVQAAGAAAFPGSLAAGHPVALPGMSTIADGIAVGRPGEVTFRHVAALVDEIVTVSEEDISRALLLLLERAKLVVEPAGAAAVAAVLAGAVEVEAPVVTVLSGGNIDPLLLLRVIEHGLSAARRYLSFTVKFEDRPGSLARMLALVAEAGGNVLDVSHARTDPRLHLGEVDVALRVETKGAEHSEELMAALRGAGYRLHFG
ncbi:MAG TPA: threonine ammonia-lyase [Mycobacteriales bacterium]|jgi:threonine dehydratase|nr:threonine ammonia-lyase [Mycobacteriales bacterium]